MHHEKRNTKWIKVGRWIARILSIFVLVLAISILVTPGTESNEEALALSYWIMLTMWMVGVLGLMIAWRFEFAGATIALAALIVRDMFYFSLSGRSFVDFKAVWLPILIPGLLFMIVWWFDRGKRKLDENFLD
jgi:K+ transporter